MSGEMIVFCAGLVALVLVALLIKSRPGAESVVAREIGWQGAAEGLGRDDYPIDYTEAEREAWQRGWDEYYERS